MGRLRWGAFRTHPQTPPRRDRVHPRIDLSSWLMRQTSVPPAAPEGPAPGTPGRRARGWTFAWKLRAAMGVVMLIGALGLAAMLAAVLRGRARARELSAREMAGLGLVLNID